MHLDQNYMKQQDMNDLNQPKIFKKDKAHKRNASKENMLQYDLTIMILEDWGKD